MHRIEPTSFPAAGSAERWGALWGARPQDWARSEEQQLPREDEIRTRIARALASHRTDDGGYRLHNEFRFLVARAP